MGRLLSFPSCLLKLAILPPIGNSISIGKKIFNGKPVTQVFSILRLAELTE